MMDQKNLLVAIVLSVAILFGFQYVFEKFLPHPAPSRDQPVCGAGDVFAARSANH